MTNSPHRHSHPVTGNGQMARFQGGYIPKAKTKGTRRLSYKDYCHWGMAIHSSRESPDLHGPGFCFGQTPSARFFRHYLKKKAPKPEPSSQYSYLKRLNQTALFDRCLNETGKQRMRFKRLGLQFRMRLHADEPRVIRPLDHLWQLPIR